MFLERFSEDLGSRPCNSASESLDSLLVQIRSSPVGMLSCRLLARLNARFDETPSTAIQRLTRGLRDACARPTR